ncbi:cytochrome c [Mucilaginibacter limnophilus]|uniref:Cytochrome c n=1 Tax=Mucilaginibacter limnophilus TaxID=1932778 RepID=A0A3S2WXU2_9SPHI|nr:cytochrome c [Mucilaginibacter limnophilus]RVU00590.1 cytochrome c [Mucilaginibacter limnophilus]
MKKLAAIAFLLTAMGCFILSCQSSEDIEFKRHYAGGMLLYQTHCQNCHGKNGEGLSALIPPLTDTNYISKNRHKLACFVQNGANGIINVSGKFYEGSMPPSGLSPIEIAKVLTYVGNSFGNKTGLINLNQVQKDLKECK